MAEGAEHRDSSRSLIYIPIVHTEADLGRLGRSIRQVQMQRSGKTVLKRKATAIDQIWSDIETAIEHLQPEYARVRLYQDGLPVCGHEHQIVEDLAASGSRNHQLLLRMIEKGATLMGTESAELLLKEYELYRQALGSSNPAKPKHPPQKEANRLLAERDRYIAGRINLTLLAGDTGILFLGMLHAPQPFIDPDIQVAYPLGKPASDLQRQTRE